MEKAHNLLLILIVVFISVFLVQCDGNVSSEDVVVVDPLPVDTDPISDIGIGVSSDGGTTNIGSGSSGDSSAEPPLATEEDDLDHDGYTIEDGDCDDNNPAIRPSALEDCNNGIDDNCNGEIDDCAPMPGHDDDGGEEDEGEGEGDDVDDLDDGGGKGGVLTLSVDDFPGGQEEPEDNEDYRSAQKLYFQGKNLNRVDAGVNYPQWRKLSVDIYFYDGKKLKNATMEDLNVHTQSYSSGVEGKNGEFNFTIDLQAYAVLNPSGSSGFTNITMGALDDVLQLSNIKRIQFHTTSIDAWGIKWLLIKAIDNEGVGRYFYKNYGVWAWVEKNDSLGYAYPNRAASCLDSSNILFTSFPGPSNITGLNYNIPEFPVGTLNFTRDDIWTKITLKTADVDWAGAPNNLKFRFKVDCDDDAWADIFSIDTRNTQKTIRFYTSGGITLSEAGSGFKIKLDSGGDDTIRIGKYEVHAEQAWSDSGSIKHYYNHWERDCRSDSFQYCRVLDPGEFFTGSMHETTETW